MGMEKAIVATADRETLIADFQRVRSYTEYLCKPLVTDDYQIQSIVQTSPPKWHIAHVTWFFEAFVLPHFKDDYKPFDPNYNFLFNSYYYTHGDLHPRPRRGLLSRPSVEDVYKYRAYVNEKMLELMESVDEGAWADLAFRVTLGLNHEEQHQELLLMDIKHNFFVNPLKPSYRNDLVLPQGETRAMNWVDRKGGIHSIGHEGCHFGYDNETPRHKVLIHDHRLADRFITNGEYLDFIKAGGYTNPALWLSDGWALIQSEQWQHPLYWEKQGDQWQQFTLGGVRDLNLYEPVCHISFYEADAYARWAGKRLPLEEELETLLEEQSFEDTLAKNDVLHPSPSGQSAQWCGELWAWTASPYSAYPGFTPLAGTMGEYNGKFMSNQMVLKGGACITPVSHARASYRNFFYPEDRWAFTGLRLAEDL